METHPVLLIGWILTVIFCVSFIISIIIYTHFYRLKSYNQQYYTLLSIQKHKPVSLLYYLQIFDLLLFICKFYIIIQNVTAYNIWKTYCNDLFDISHLNAEQYISDDHTQEISNCKMDKYCNFSEGGDDIYDVCIPTAASSIGAIVILSYFFPITMGIIISFAEICCLKSGYGACGDSCYALCCYRQHIIRLYDRKQLFVDKYSICKKNNATTTEVVKHAINISFFVLMMAFGGIYDGPNDNYIRWYLVMILFIWWIFNELIVKCIIYQNYPDYDEAAHCLSILEDHFGEHIGSIIWIDFLDGNVDVDIDTRTGLMMEVNTCVL